MSNPSLPLSPHMRGATPKATILHCMQMLNGILTSFGSPESVMSFKNWASTFEPQKEYYGREQVTEDCQERIVASKITEEATQVLDA